MVVAVVVVAAVAVVVVVMMMMKYPCLRKLALHLVGDGILLLLALRPFFAAVCVLTVASPTDTKLRLGLQSILFLLHPLCAASSTLAGRVLFSQTPWP